MSENRQMTPVLEVDATGLACPLPLLRAKQALHQVMAGECVRVVATDAGSVRDFHTFAELSGHRLLGFEERLNTYIYLLQKCPEPTRC